MGTTHPPPFPDLVRTYTRRITRAARCAGIPPADVADVVQEVFVRLHTAIKSGRLDTSRSLLGWLLKTTRSIARDRLALARSRYESLTAPDAIERLADSPDRENRMSEATDVHAIIDRILDKLRPQDREVFVMSDLEDTPMVEVMEELNLKRATAYARLAAGRAAFAREWKAMQESGDPALVPFLPLAMEDLIAAEHVPPEVPPGFTDDILRRLAERLGPNFAGPPSPPSSSPGGALGTVAAASAAAAGAVTLAAWKLALLCFLMVLVGAGLHATLGPSQEPANGPASAATVATTDPTPVTSSGPPSAASTLGTTSPPLETPPEGSASATPAHENQEALLESARRLLRAHDPTKALTVLARVNAPYLAASRDALRHRALAEQATASHP